METFNSGFLKKVFVLFLPYIYLTEKNQIDLNLKRQRNQKWLYFYKHVIYRRAFVFSQ